MANSNVKIKITIVVGVALAAALGVTLLAVAEQAPPSADYFSAALHTQEGGCGGSIEVRYEVVPTTTKIPSGSLDQGADKPMLVNAATGVHYIRTSSRQFAEEVLSIDGKEVYRKKHSYDRNTGQSITFQQPAGDAVGSAVIGEGRGFFGGAVMLDPVLTCWSEQPLADLCARGSVKGDMEQVDDRPCYRIDVAPVQGYVESHSVWLDPSIGFCPRRVAVLRADGSERVRTSFLDYRLAGEAVWFPWRVVIVCRDADGSVWNTADYRVSELNLGKTFADNELGVTIPPGTRVSVRGSGVAFTQP